MLILLLEMDGDQPVMFYYIDPGYALERHAGKAKFKNKFYYQYEFEESWTRPGVRAFGRVNGGLAFQGFQKIAGNAVPLCSVFYADKAGSTKNCSHHPIYGIILFYITYTTYLLFLFCIYLFYIVQLEHILDCLLTICLGVVIVTRNFSEYS